MSRTLCDDSLVFTPPIPSSTKAKQSELHKLESVCEVDKYVGEWLQHQKSPCGKKFDISSFRRPPCFYASLSDQALSWVSLPPGKDIRRLRLPAWHKWYVHSLTQFAVSNMGLMIHSCICLNSIKSLREEQFLPLDETSQEVPSDSYSPPPLLPGLANNLIRLITYQQTYSIQLKNKLIFQELVFLLKWPYSNVESL